MRTTKTKSVRVSGHPAGSKARKTTGKAAANKAGAGPTQTDAGWDEEDEVIARPNTPTGSAAGSATGSVDTRAAENDAYFGPGASSTDLGARASRPNYALAALDLALPFSHAPMLVPPVSLPWLESKHPTVESLVVKAALLNDGRLVDAKGRSYLPGALDRKTELSAGGMLVSFDAIKPQAYWAKRVAVPNGQPLPDDLRREVELNFKAKSNAAMHLILRTPDAFYLLMPHMMGDSLSLFGVLDRFAKQLQASVATPGGKPADPALLQRAQTDLLQVKRTYSAQMLQAVADAHDKDIFHRDIKLENFAYHMGDVSLIDFGSAHVGNAAPEVAISTPAYLAPDHLLVEGGTRSAAKADVYAAAISVYTLLTGDNFLLPAVVAYNQAAAAFGAAELAVQQAKQIPEGATKAPKLSGELVRSYNAARDALLVALAGVDSAKENYSVAWPWLHQAASQLDANRNDLVGKSGDVLAAAVGKLIDLDALARKLAPLSPLWAESVPKLLLQEPLGALSLVNALAPTDAQRSTAQQTARAFKAATLATGEQAHVDLLKIIGQMHATQTQRVHAQAETMAKNLQRRLASPGPYFDELQLENQPDVASLEEAKAYIQKLATEPAPRIPVLDDTAGGIKRIRELYVKLR